MKPIDIDAALRKSGRRRAAERAHKRQAKLAKLHKPAAPENIAIPADISRFTVGQIRALAARLEYASHFDTVGNAISKSWLTRTLRNPRPDFRPLDHGTSFHEAGHLVAHVALIGGYAYFKRERHRDCIVSYPRKCKPNAERAFRHAIVCYAGPAAEALLTGHTIETALQLGGWSDRREIERRLPDETLRPAARRAAVALVKEHWGVIAEVAASMRQAAHEGRPGRVNTYNACIYYGQVRYVTEPQLPAPTPTASPTPTANTEKATRI